MDGQISILEEELTKKYNTLRSLFELFGKVEQFFNALHFVSPETEVATFEEIAEFLKVEFKIGETTLTSDQKSRAMRFNGLWDKCVDQESTVLELKHQLSMAQVRAAKAIEAEEEVDEDNDGNDVREVTNPKSSTSTSSGSVPRTPPRSKKRRKVPVVSGSGSKSEDGDAPSHLEKQIEKMMERQMDKMMEQLNTVSQNQALLVKEVVMMKEQSRAEGRLITMVAEKKSNVSENWERLPSVALIRVAKDLVGKNDADPILKLAVDKLEEILITLAKSSVNRKKETKQTSQPKYSRGNPKTRRFSKYQQGNR